MVRHVRHRVAQGLLIVGLAILIAFAAYNAIWEVAAVAAFLFAAVVVGLRSDLKAGRGGADAELDYHTPGSHRRRTRNLIWGLMALSLVLVLTLVSVVQDGFGQSILLIIPMMLVLIYWVVRASFRRRSADDHASTNGRSTYDPQ